jgi:hypothetical protein
MSPSAPFAPVRSLARRRFLGLVLASPILLPLALAACGDDGDTESGSAASSGSTLPPADPTRPSTAPTSATVAIAHPTGSDDVVLWIGSEGGFVPVEVAFQHLPTLLVSGDGRAVQPGVQIEIYPGPLLPNLQQRTISEAGIQELLGLADEMGLFEPGSYEGPEATIADAPFTVVRISANGTTIEHRAYALGIDPAVDEEGDRARLAEFVARATDLSTAVGDAELGHEEPYVADAYRIRASVAGDASGLEIEPTVVDWPADASVRLATATECAEVPVDEFADVFASATQLTWFRDGDVIYQVSAAPSLPGETC